MTSPLLDPPTSAQRILPFIVGCALLMQMLDSTVVTTALPAMARDLGSDPISMNITITSYLIAVAMFVPVSEWAADRFGARKVFIAAIVLFTLSSLTCALSNSLTQLVISRVVQGLGGAMMVPVGRIILLRTIPKHNLLKAMAFISMPELIGPMEGPPLRGLLVTYASLH
jgi:MFS family permease